MAKLGVPSKIFTGRESGNTLVMALLGLVAVGAGGKYMADKVGNNIEETDAFLVRQATALVAEEIKSTAESIHAIRVSADKPGNGSWKNCVVSGGGNCNAGTYNNFNLYNSSGERVAGPYNFSLVNAVGQGVTYTRYGARCTTSNCPWDLVATARLVATCKGGATSCSSADSVRIEFRVQKNEYNSSKAGVKLVDVTTDKSGKMLTAIPATFTCGDNEVMKGINDLNEPVCIPKTSIAAVQGNQGSQGDQGDVGGGGGNGQKGDTGPKGDTIQQRLTGCFPGDVRLTLEGGLKKAIADIRPGDRLLNPLTGRVSEIKKMVRGEEKSALRQIGAADSQVVVTEKHPLFTKRGIIPADQLKSGDEIMTVSRGWQPVLFINVLPIEPNQVVYNVEVDGSHLELGHALASDGIVTGDLWIQEKLAKDNAGFWGWLTASLSSRIDAR